MKYWLIILLNFNLTHILYYSSFHGLFFFLLFLSGQDQRRLVSDSKRDGLHFGSLGSDRFGQPYARKTTQDPVPGPGTYGNITEDVRPKALASSSAFLSESKRGIDGMIGSGKPPGPAFYRPRKNMKKSFMLNSSSKWV